MDTPMPSHSERLVDVFKQIKPRILEMAGYQSPPQGKVIAKLNQNENPYELPDSLKEKILRDICYMDWSRYPENNCSALRKKLARHLGINADQVVLGNGSNALLHVVFTALIEPGDTVLVSPPSFSLFEHMAGLFQAKIVTVSRNPDFSYDRDPLIKSVRTVKLTIISSPCNPTGRCMDTELLTTLLRGTKGLILWDEAYGEFRQNSAVPLLAKHPNLLILKTFSKAMGLAGARIGYLLAHPLIAAELQKATVPYNLNIFSIQTALRLLDISRWTEYHIGKILEQRQFVWDALNRLDGVEPFPTEANFILFRVGDGPSVIKKLQDRGILVRNMNGYPRLRNCLRVTIGTPRENQLFLDALTEIVQSKKFAREEVIS
ncbi:histidinol-phosphate transaminase [bacterium]